MLALETFNKVMFKGYKAHINFSNVCCSTVLFSHAVIFKAAACQKQFSKCMAMRTKCMLYLERKCQIRTALVIISWQSPSDLKIFQIPLMICSLELEGGWKNRLATAIPCNYLYNQLFSFAWSWHNARFSSRFCLLQNANGSS